MLHKPYLFHARALIALFYINNPTNAFKYVDTTFFHIETPPHVSALKVPSSGSTDKVNRVPVQMWVPRIWFTNSVLCAAWQMSNM